MWNRPFDSQKEKSAPQSTPRRLKVSKGESQPYTGAALLILYRVLGRPFLCRVLIVTQVSESDRQDLGYTGVVLRGWSPWPSREWTDRHRVGLRATLPGKGRRRRASLR